MSVSKVCKDCNKELQDGRDRWWETMTDPVVYTCQECKDTAQMKDFKEKGELTDALIMRATMAWCRLGDTLDRVNENDAAATSWFLEKYRRHPIIETGTVTRWETVTAPPEMIERARVLLRVWKGELADVFRAYIAIREEFDKFSEAYSDSIRDYWNKAKERGHTADCGTFKILLWGCAGRIVFSLQGVDPKFGNARVDCIMSDDTKEKLPANLNGMCATKDEAIGLIQAAMACDIKFVADDDVAPIPVHIARAQQRAEAAG